MSAALISGIDHIVLAVHDLEQARRALTKLGFSVNTNPQGGTLDRAHLSIAFERNYLEVVAPSPQDQAADVMIRKRLSEKGEGVLTLCLKSSDLEGLKSHCAASETPLSADSGVCLPIDALPGLSEDMLLVKDQSQQMLPSLSSRHPNGAQGIFALTALTADPEAVMGEYDRFFGPAASTPTDSTISIHTSNGLIMLSKPDEVSQLHPEADIDPETPAASGIVAVMLSVADTNAIAPLLTENQIPFTRDQEGTIRLQPQQACGLFLELVSYPL